jgi:hypothetical protein
VSFLRSCLNDELCLCKFGGRSTYMFGPYRLMERHMLLPKVMKKCEVITHGFCFSMEAADHPCRGITMVLLCLHVQISTGAPYSTMQQVPWVKRPEREAFLSYSMSSEV